MEDERLVAAFETGELSADDFTHREHVRVAWWYLTRYSFAEARERFSTALRRFAIAKGRPERYHETITIAYLLLIADRVRVSRELPWTAFAEQHGDLLAWNPSILARHFADETLQSELARREFVTADLEPLPQCCR